MNPTSIVALFFALLKLTLHLGNGGGGVHLALGVPGFTQAVLPALRYSWAVRGLWASAGLKKKKEYFIFRLCWFFIAAHGLSLVVVSGGYTLLCVGFSLRWLLDAEQGCRCLGSVIAVHLSLAALRHMGSSWTGDETSVPCIARWILNHCFPGGTSGKEHACQCRTHESVSQSVQ